MHAPDCEKLPRRNGEPEGKRHQAACADRHEVHSLQTKPVGRPPHQGPQTQSHPTVERRKNADLGETEAKVPGIQRQAEADQAKAEPREQPLRDDCHQWRSESSFHRASPFRASPFPLLTCGPRLLVERSVRRAKGSQPRFILAFLAKRTM